MAATQRTATRPIMAFAAGAGIVTLAVVLWGTLFNVPATSVTPGHGLRQVGTTGSSNAAARHSSSGSSGGSGGSSGGGVVCVPSDVPLPLEGEKYTPGDVVAGNKWTSGELPTVRTVGGARFPLVRRLDTIADWATPPVELNGQVRPDTTFGRGLQKLVKRPDVHLMLEIGTWFGGGSTWCIGTAMREALADAAHPDKWLFTMELFEPAFQYAAQTVSRLPVTCFQAGTVGRDGYIKEEDIPAAEKNEHFFLYYHRDLNLADQQPQLLQPLCSRYDFDAVLIDGNEYTGWAEFEIVRRVCRPRYIALHDCGTLKTRRVQALLDTELAAEWRIIDSGEDQAKWAIYQFIGADPKHPASLA